MSEKTLSSVRQIDPRKIRNGSPSLVKPCANCGQQFRAYQYEIKNNRGRYCCRKCAGAGRSKCFRAQPVDLFFWRKVNKDGPIPNQCPKLGPCWLWSGYVMPSSGYGQIKSRQRQTLAHRFAYELANGDIPNGLLVCHHCDNKLCVNPVHLFLGTDMDNVRDCIQKGRKARGETSGLNKLTAEQVRRIREMATQSIPMSKIAHAFTVNISCIWKIVHRKRWAHI